MTDVTDVTVRLAPEDGDDPDDILALATRLRAELLELDVSAVEFVAEPTSPEHAKGLGTLAGWLTVRVAAGRLRALVGLVYDWASRSKRTVDVSYGGDTLKLSGVTTAQQEKIINDWIARHAPRA